MSPIFSQPCYLGSSPIQQAYLNTVPLFAKCNESNVITENLIMHLDAGNPLSYPGTGSTWTDLSSSNNHGTIIGPEVTWDPFGAFHFTTAPPAEFTQSNSPYTETRFVALTPTNNFILGNVYTLEFWCYYDYETSIAGETAFDSGCLFTMGASKDWNDDTGTNNGLMIGHFEVRTMVNRSEVAKTFDPKPAGKQWHHIVHVGNNTNSRNYVDGQIVTPDYTTGEKNKSQSQYMGIGRGDMILAGNSNKWNRGFFPGYIAIARIYAEKALTEAEVKQNYEAQKCRYEGVTMPDIGTNFIPDVSDANVHTDTLSYLFFENATSDDSDSVIDGEVGDDVITFNDPEEYANTDT